MVDAEFIPGVIPLPFLELHQGSRGPVYLQDTVVVYICPVTLESSIYTLIERFAASGGPFFSHVWVVCNSQDPLETMPACVSQRLSL